MSWAWALPYFKILPYGIYIAIYFAMTGYGKGYPEESIKTVTFKALPMISLIFMVLSCATQSKEHGRFKAYVIIGLLFSMAGDAFLVWRNKLFTPGLLAFAIAQAFYTCAFTMHPFGGVGPFLLSYGVGGYIFWFICGGINDPVMKGLIFMYTVLIITMGWRILVRLTRDFNLGSLCGFLGAASFVASDTMIAVDKFVSPIQDACFWIMVTYFVAQLGISLSACYNPESAGNYAARKAKSS